MLLLAVALTAAAPAVADVETRLTGCLAAGKGALYYVQEGPSPSQPCGPGDRTITWNIVGPAGPAGPAGPPAPAPPRFRFVGVTAQRFNGAAGWAQMTRACFNQFPGSRVATSEEYRATVNPPQVPEDAWIAVSPAFMAQYQSGGSSEKLIDRTGTSLDSRIDCTSWTVTANVGAVVSPTGSIYQQYCDVQRPVACAAPE